MATLHSLLATNARSIPDKPALIFGERQYSYAELDAEVNRYARALQSLGVEKGDRVAILATNSDRFLIAFYGGLKAGAVVTPFNPRSAAPELRYLLADSGAKVLMFSAETLAAVQGLKELEPLAVKLLSLDGAAGFDDLPTLAASMPNMDPGVDVSESDDAIILYTSGTTGAPKGALFDHHRPLWVGHMMSALGLTTFDRILHVAPLYHGAELVLFAFTGMSLGATHVVMPSFEPVAVLDALQRHRISVFLGVPTMYQMMLEVPGVSERQFPDWRLGFFGAAPMPPTAVAQLVKTLPSVNFIQLCGPTEAGPAGIYSAPEEVVARPDATGRRAIPYVEMRIVVADGKDVVVGETGEIILRGDTIMKGYWNKPEATAEAIRDGWLRTGDLGVRDADGYITLVDRLKDMIITGGMNVYSVEVESAIAAHPKVADCAVIGVPNEKYGESILAVVVPRAGTTLTLEELKAHCRALIADYKVPHLLELSAIPRNPSGKIVKHKLRDQMAEGRQARA